MAGLDGKGITDVLKVGVERHLTLTVAIITSYSCMRELAIDAAALRFKEHADAVHTANDANAADKAGGIGVSINVGSSSSQSKQSSSGDNARGSSSTLWAALPSKPQARAIR